MKKEVTNDLQLPELIKWMKRYIAVATQDKRIKDIAFSCHRNFHKAVDQIRCVNQKIYSKIVYRPDKVTYDKAGKKKQIHSLKPPHVAFNKGYGNCHTYAIMNAAVLLNMGFEPILRFYSWTGKTWDHVAVIVDGIVLDQSAGQNQKGDNFESRPKFAKFNPEPLSYADKKDVALSKLLLVQGRQNPNYFAAKAANKEQAERLGLVNIFGSRKNTNIQGAKEDFKREWKKAFIRLWLSKFSRFPSRDRIIWEARDAVIKEATEIGVKQKLTNLAEWYVNAADSGNENAQQAIKPNVSPFLRKVLLSKDSSYAGLNSLKEKISIPEKFKKLDSRDKIVPAVRFFFAKYFMHKMPESLSANEWKNMPNATRGTAYQVINATLDRYINQWIGRFHALPPGVLRRNMTVKEAQEETKFAANQLPLEDVNVNVAGNDDGTSWMAWIPVALGVAGLGYAAYRGGKK